MAATLPPRPGRHRSKPVVLHPDIEAIQRALTDDPRPIPEIAAIAGLSPQSVAKFRVGDMPDPSFKTVKGLLRALGWPLAALDPDTT